MPRFVSPLMEEGAERFQSGPLRAFVRWGLGPLAIAGRFCCSMVLIVPYAAVVHLTPEQWPRFAALVPTLLVLGLFGLAIGRSALHQWRRAHEVNLDDVAFVCGCAFWFAASLLFLNYFP